MKATDALFESIYPSNGMLVIGLVAQVGTNLNDLCAALKTRLSDKDYEVHTIDLSKFLTNKGQSTKNKQTQGTDLRRKLSCHHSLALCSIAEIRNYLGNNANRSKKAFIIRSLKRPEEVESLRIVYGEAFMALGIHTPKSKRMHYLTDVKGDTEPEETIGADENAADHYGQRTRDTFEFCDYFIKGIDPEFTGLSRALKLCFGSIFTTPSLDEYAMAMAYAASLRSADLSRQVGAAIVNSSREVVAVGANEVPMFGGGQPWPDDSPDLRDFAELGYDPNIVHRDTLIRGFLESLGKTGQQLLPLTEDPSLHSLLKESGLLDITEFGRTVHAEMACLLSCLRNYVDVRHAALYSSTFPCHNCMRHIIASGISCVKYIEPYPKSQAQKLFSESCCFWDDDYNEKTGEKLGKRPGLRVEPFIGIGPRKYHDLFAMKTLSGKRIERKDGLTGKAIPESTKLLQQLKWPTSHFGMEEREDCALEQLVSLWKPQFKTDFPEIDKIVPTKVTASPTWKAHIDSEPTSQKKRQSKRESSDKKKSASRGTKSKPKDNSPIMNVEDGGRKSGRRTADDFGS